MSTLLVGRAVRSDWEGLVDTTCNPSRFDPGVLGGVPEPVRRWLGHAIAAGTPLFGSVRLTMHGQIRLGRWRDFEAVQVVAPQRGYVWAARTRLLGMRVSGYDRLSRGEGEMRWRALGLIPVLSARGEDVTRSAAGRLAGEIVLAPTAFGAATWALGNDPDSAVGSWRIATGGEEVRIRVGPNGAVRHVRMQRWGNPGGRSFARYPFDVAVEQEETFGPVTIPSRFAAGWRIGAGPDEGDFFRARITDAVVGPPSQDEVGVPSSLTRRGRRVVERSRTSRARPGSWPPEER